MRWEGERRERKVEGGKEERKSRDKEMEKGSGDDKDRGDRRKAKEGKEER